MPPPPGRPSLNDGARRPIAIVAGLVAASVLLLLCSWGTLQGVPAVLLALVCVLAVPTSAVLARRVAINSALVIGVLPLLWWVPIAPVAGVGRSAALLAATAGVIVFLALWGPRSRRRLLPATRGADAVILLGAAGAIWFVLPLLAFSSPGSALNTLVQGTGTDNVAHFDMVEMVRVLGVAGHFWGSSPDGSAVAYVTYPQQFHSLVAAAAELWGGTTVGSYADEASLYLASTALVLVVAFIGVCAALADLPLVRRSSVVAAVPVAAAFSVVFLGFGASALAYGFAGFLVAILATALALLLGLGRSSSSLLELVAVAALTGGVAHLWSLLTPIALAALVAVTLRLPWAWIRRRRARTLAVVATWAVSSLVVVFAAVLVLRSTSASGSPGDALATPGGILAVPLIQTAERLVILVLAGLLVAAFWAGRRFHRLRPVAPVVFGALTAIALGLAVLGLQLLRGTPIGYFQYKLSNGLFILASILSIAVVTFLVVRGRDGRGFVRRPLVIPVAVLAIAVFAFDAAFAVGVQDPLAPPALTPGLAFRASLESQPDAPTPAVAHVTAAATAMERSSCARPVFIAAEEGDLPAIEANQWAMAFSRRWSEAAGPINTMLVNDDPRASEELLVSDIEAVLDEGTEYCVILSPTTFARLPDSVTSGRVTSWSD